MRRSMAEADTRGDSRWIRSSARNFDKRKIFRTFVGMEDFLIYNTLEDRKYPDAYRDNYHCHILCRSGEMQFDAVGKSFTAGPGDLVIWQMTTDVSNVRYSADFDADFVLISNPFLNLYNPEQVWATKGYVYIKSHPVFHLENDEWDVIEADFEQFRHRINSRFTLFFDDKVGRVFQLLLMDMWGIYSREMENMDTDETSARIFMKFLYLLQQHCRQEREVAWYADKLCVTPKYLSAICQKMTGKSGSYWIEYYTLHEILLLLNNPDLTLTDVTDRMHFPAPPMLTRYFKRVTGITPSEYRAGK